MKYINNNFKVNHEFKIVDCSGLGLTEIPNELIGCDYFLNLSNNKITSIRDFIQVSEINLSNNRINCINGFNQTKSLNLNYNNVSSIDNFDQNSPLYLRGNK